MANIPALLIGKNTTDEALKTHLIHIDTFYTYSHIYNAKITGRKRATAAGNLCY